MPESLPVRDPVTPPTRAPWMEDATVAPLYKAIREDAERAAKAEYPSWEHPAVTRKMERERDCWIENIDALCTAVASATLAAQGRELAELREDAARLDWLEAGNDVLVVGERMTVRESIDAAMKHPVRLGVQMITAARSRVPQDGEAAK